MSNMKREWEDYIEELDTEHEKPEYAQAGITRETLARMKSWIAKDIIQKAKKND